MTKILAALFLLLSINKGLIAQDTTALTIAKKVADKVIRETLFEFEPVMQKHILGLQVIDLRHPALKNGEVAYAYNNAQSLYDTLVNFGISSSEKISVWVNKKLVYKQEKGRIGNPKEIAYGRFDFNNQFSAPFRKGKNEVLIKVEKGGGAPVAFLRPILGSKDLDNAIKFDDVLSLGWKMAVFSSSNTLSPTEELKTHYSEEGKMITWQTAPASFLPELKIDSNATYKRDSYADWNYANGATLWSIMSLDDDKYIQFVKQYSQFILDNHAFFKWQYDSLFAYRGSFHRMFRLSMLDDSGTPALPLVELYLKDKDPALKRIIEPISNYVFSDQMRLGDGTFCRPEPINYTVWADDLFMSVPFLLRMARMTGEQKYYDDAGKQVTNFKKYLFDNSTQMYKHGWFSNTKEKSIAYWGRANGWVVWATTELLTWLPLTHPNYKTVLKMYREHIGSLVTYQNANGMWHQLLNRKESYEETSCTALFTLAIARGVRKGWLSKDFKKNAISGWNAVKKKIDTDGTVHGICRGTEIGFDEQFYMDRPTVDHDPRGLGAVITAGIEISKLK